MHELTHAYHSEEYTRSKQLIKALNTHFFFVVPGNEQSLLEMTAQGHSS